MLLTQTHKFILFALGFWYREANKKLKDKNLTVNISKALFIDILKKADIVKKQERALYKNLEYLEENKLIKYENKNLILTKLGEKNYSKIYGELEPYMTAITLVTEKDPLSYSQKIQTRFTTN